MAEEKKLNKVGVAVSTISSTIIIFILAGGTFEGTANIVIGSVRFDRPWVLELSVIVLFLYWFYRLNVVVNKPWAKFKNYILEDLINDISFVRFAHQSALKEAHRIAREKQLGWILYSPEQTIDIKWNSDAEKPIIVRKHSIAIPINVVVKEKEELLHQTNIYLDAKHFWILFWKQGLKSDYPFTLLLPWVLAYLAIPLICYALIKRLIIFL